MAFAVFKFSATRASALGHKQTFRIAIALIHRQIIGAGSPRGGHFHKFCDGAHVARGAHPGRRDFEFGFPDAAGVMDEDFACPQAHLLILHADCVIQSVGRRGLVKEDYDSTVGRGFPERVRF
jgi:hypothetical protein